MFLNDPDDAIQLRLPESIVVRQTHRCKPELRELAVALHVDVDRLVSVAGKEEKPVRAALQDRRTHSPDSASFPGSVPT